LQPAFQRFLLRALRWLHGAPWSAQPSARDVPLAEFGRESLERLHRKALKQARDIDWRDAARRHVVRIRVKRLRYGCEFFAPCFPHASVRPYLKRLQALQDILGELNDVTVARRLISGLAPRGAAPPIARGAARARRLLAAREQALIAALAPAWAALEKRRRFWRGRAREATRAAA
jgi:CHAD domain-containing protein